MIEARQRGEHWDRAYSWALENAILPVGNALTRQRLLGRLDYLRAAQWWPREQIVAEQERLLSAMVKLAAGEVPFYRRQFAAAHVDWRDIRSARDLRQLPISYKDAMRREYPSGITRKTGLPVNEESSSGSTGEPFRVLEDSATAGIRRASFLLALEWAGWRPGARHMQTGVISDRSRLRWWKDTLLRCRYEPVLELDDALLDGMLDRIDGQRIEYLWGYPCGIWALAVRARVLGWNRKLRSVVTWGDNLYPRYRNEIEAAFGTQVFDTYGCAEGVQIAGQCGQGTSYHVHDLDTIVELVDDQGSEVPDGQPGRVLLTRLHAGATPLIRYAVGDVAVRSARQQCPCGRELSLIERIDGRDSDFVVSPDGTRYLVHFFALVIEAFPEIERYQVVQTRPDRVLVRIVARPGADGLEAALASSLLDHGLNGLAVEVERVVRIDESAPGKRRFVIAQNSRASEVKSSILTADVP